jgi:hypothetical protein
MIDSAGRLQNRTAADAMVSSGSKSQPSRSQSFALELADRLSGTTTGAPEPAVTRTSIPIRQQSVTGQGSESSNASTAGSTSNAAAQPSGLEALVAACAIATPGGASGTASSTASRTTSTPESFDAAYWAGQPAAVQQLQNIQNPEQRAALAEQLTQQGYSIDVPIMVWGWDPAITTSARESMGYTWVPSAGQAPVEAAPGLTFAGTTYNPSQPPPGSITV